MAISIIISNFNGAQYLPKLLETLKAQEDVETQIIVVDRESVDNSLEILAGHPDVVVTSERPQTGLVAGYHAGVAHADHEHLFFCNEDMWFEPDCLKALESRIDLESRVGATDPWQWTYDGQDWIHGGVRFREHSWDVNSPYPFRVTNNIADLVVGTEIPFPCAGALLIHRDVYEELGGWDTSFFLDDEDTDLFLRAWQHGWKSVTVPEAKVYHAVSASSAHEIEVKQKQIPVKKRRYISTCANKSIIALKYFSFPSVMLAVGTWLTRTMNNLIKGRFRWAVIDFQVLPELMRRTPQALRYRAANAKWNRERPGEQFFLVDEFQDRNTEQPSA